uniref:Uncharacterized protein n=1 Tax=Trichogramma kaykai TaxID=54128 RepID=A0ABD2XAT4_9HYME
MNDRAISLCNAPDRVNDLGSAQRSTSSMHARARRFALFTVHHAPRENHKLAGDTCSSGSILLGTYTRVKIVHASRVRIPAA